MGGTFFYFFFNLTQLFLKFQIVRLRENHGCIPASRGDEEDSGQVAHKMHLSRAAASMKAA